MPKKRTTKGRKKRMSDTTETKAEAVAEVLKEKVDLKNDVRLEISSEGDTQTLKIFIKAPILAEVIRKMAPGNYPKENFADIYKPLLVELEANKKLVVTRPAIAKATKNFASAADFSFEEPPRPILLANPDMLAAGYTLSVKVEKPIPPDILRRWGKQFMDGCADIIQNARPFKMSWVMQEVGK